MGDLLSRITQKMRERRRMARANQITNEGFVDQYRQIRGGGVFPDPREFSRIAADRDEQLRKNRMSTRELFNDYMKGYEQGKPFNREHAQYLSDLARKEEAAHAADLAQQPLNLQKLAEQQGIDPVEGRKKMRREREMRKRDKLFKGPKPTDKDYWPELATDEF